MQKNTDAVFLGLAVVYNLRVLPHRDSSDDPEGFVTLFFADGGAIRLHVECIEAELRDLEPVE